MIPPHSANVTQRFRFRPAFPALVAALLATPLAAHGADPTEKQGAAEATPEVEAAHPSDDAMREAARAAAMIRLARFPGAGKLSVAVWAAEPLLQDPVALAFDERGRMFVAESRREKNVAVLDSRDRHNWPSPAFRAKQSPYRLENIARELLDADMAARTLDDRERMIKNIFQGDLDRFTSESDVLRRVVDTNDDGLADVSTTVAKWNGMLDGILAGVLVHKGDIFVTNIPSLWKLRDDNDDGVADTREELSRGYGIRWAFHGHDMHGLRVGPDGRVYFSIGDRGSNVRTKEGATLANTETGSVFRCDPDGRNLEVFHTGLRNPQELAFDEFGNLFTGDNNSDGGDRARIVYLVEGGDSGWRIGWQHQAHPGPRGAWIAEHMDQPAHALRPTSFVPPVGNLGNGPSGFAYHPGTGSPSALKGHFFMADFKGQANQSGAWAFRVKPQGAGFAMVKPQQVAWGVLATDVDFGPDGGLYVLDWVAGWSATGKGRVHRITDAAGLSDSRQHRVKELLASDFQTTASDAGASLDLLRHPDQRIRQSMQFALVDARATDTLLQATRDRNLVTRLHGLWGLSQLARRGDRDAQAGAASHLLTLLGDRDAEIRAQAARALGEARHSSARPALIAALADRAPRVQFLAATALGVMGKAKTDETGAWEAILGMLARNRDRDAYVRHGGVLAMLGYRGDLIANLAQHQSASVRMAAVIALRRLADPRIQAFLGDSDLRVAREAVRSINDSGITLALPALAAVNDKRLLADEPIAIRVVAAAAQMGSHDGAHRLGDLLGNETLPTSARADAVEALAAWADPPQRNRVTGLHEQHPAGPRDQEVARVILEKHAIPILQGPHEPMVIATTRAAAHLRLTAVAPVLAELSQRSNAALDPRLSALEALYALGDASLGDVLPLLARDREPALRLTALQMRFERSPTQAGALATAALGDPALAVQQTGVALLAKHKDTEATEVLGGMLDRMLTGKLNPGLVLDVLEAAAANGDAGLATRVQTYEDQRPKDELGPYVETLVGGDAKRGKGVFFGHEQVMCRRCHSIEGHGAMAGPDLLGIGRKRDRRYLLESVVFPSKHFAPGFESVMLTMTSGAIHGGTLKRETAQVLDLDSVDEGALRLEKKAIAERERGVSGMPEGFGAILKKRELRDLVEFLASH